MSNTEGLRRFYTGKTIFITGATGFLGVCLLEKILRTIPDHGEIYLLMRPKRGKEIIERLEEIKKNCVFERLLEEEPVEKVFDKVRPIAGDVGQEGLGLSEHDREFLRHKVNVIFHSAATLDFGENLKTTIDINLLGTRRITELAEQCTNLNVLVHVSSAYVNSYRLDADEVIYPLPRDSDDLINEVSKLSPEELEKRTPDILGDHPNTYTLTKHMAEHEIKRCEDKFPCTIVRPSMIMGAWKEPMPGWTISKNGPQGFLMGASKGIIRRLPVAKHLVYDYIPVDIVVNNLLAAGYHAGVTKPKKVEIYQSTSSTRNPFKWTAVENSVNNYLHEFPLMSAVWYPNLKFIPSITYYKISAFFVHIIPALFLDTLTRATGGRPIFSTFCTYNVQDRENPLQNKMDGKKHEKSDGPKVNPKEKLYAVMKFDNGEISTVPKLWISRSGEETMCKWPPKGKNVSNYAKNLNQPTVKWDDYKVTQIYRYFFDYSSSREYEAQLSNLERSTDDNSSSFSSDSNISLKRASRSSRFPKTYKSDSESSVESDWETTLKSMSTCDLQSKDKEVTIYDVDENGCVKENTINSSNSKQETIAKESQVLKEVNEKEKIMVDETHQNYDDIEQDLTITTVFENRKDKEVTLQSIDLKLDLIISLMQNHPNPKTLQQTEKIYLPLQTLNELEETEEQLDKPTYYNTLYQTLVVIGGKTAQKAIRRMLGRIFGEQLATKCSYTGQKNNFKVQDLKVVAIIKDIAREQYGQISDYEFEKTAMDFFRYASQRCSRNLKNLLKLHRNVNTSLGRLAKFIFTEWKFSANNTMELQKWLNSDDKDDFNLDISALVWPVYFDDLTLGARTYLSKEPKKTIEAAKKKDKILLAVHIIFKIVLTLLLAYGAARLVGVDMLQSAIFVIPLCLILYSVL